MSAYSIKTAMADLIDGAAVTPNLQHVSATTLPYFADTKLPMALVYGEAETEEREAGNAGAGIKHRRYRMKTLVRHFGKDYQATEVAFDSILKQIEALYRGAGGSPSALPLAGAADVGGDNSRVINFADEITTEHTERIMTNTGLTLEAEITVLVFEGLNA